MIEEAINITRTAEIFVVVGTSLVVYPAAGLVNYAPWRIPKFIVDKKIPYTSSLYNLTAIEMPATEGVKELQKKLKEILVRRETGDHLKRYEIFYQFKNDKRIIKVHYGRKTMVCK